MTNQKIDYGPFLLLIIAAFIFIVIGKIIGLW